MSQPEHFFELHIWPFGQVNFGAKAKVILQLSVLMGHPTDSYDAKISKLKSVNRVPALPPFGMTTTTTFMQVLAWHGSISSNIRLAKLFVSGLMRQKIVFTPSYIMWGRNGIGSYHTVSCTVFLLKCSIVKKIFTRLRFLPALDLRGPMRSN